jgi:hypothetical protein
MIDGSSDRDGRERPEGAQTDRRDFVRSVATAGVVGAAGFVSALVGRSEAASPPQAETRDPAAPAGLGPKGIPDLRFQICYDSVPHGVAVLTQYFAALTRRDLKGMARSLQFPFATYEGADPVVVETPEDLLAHAPASMNMSEDPERFTDHDGYLKPGAYDVFAGMEILNSDPVRVNMALTYDRYGRDGRKLLRCQGVYCATNNDGQWGIQLMSTIFTPADLERVVFTDTIEAAKRVRINHDLAFQVSDEEGVWGRVRQYGHLAGISGGAAWAVAPDGNDRVMQLYRFKGIKNRLTMTEETPESLAKIHVDFPQVRDSVGRAGVGNWGFPVGILPDTRVLHAGIDKAHMYSGVTRYNVTGEEISNSVEVSIITYKKGRWGWAGGLAYTTNHDRANDIHS